MQVWSAAAPSCCNLAVSSLSRQNSNADSPDSAYGLYFIFSTYSFNWADLLQRRVFNIISFLPFNLSFKNKVDTYLSPWNFVAQDIIISWPFLNITFTLVVCTVQILYWWFNVHWNTFSGVHTHTLTLCPWWYRVGDLFLWAIWDPVTQFKYLLAGIVFPLCVGRFVFPGFVNQEKSKPEVPPATEWQRTKLCRIEEESFSALTTYTNTNTIHIPFWQRTKLCPIEEESFRPLSLIVIITIFNNMPIQLLQCYMCTCELAWACLHFRQLRTVIHDNHHCDLTIKSDNGKHSQFCFGTFPSPSSWHGHDDRACAIVQCASSEEGFPNFPNSPHDFPHHRHLGTVLMSARVQLCIHLWRRDEKSSAGGKRLMNGFNLINTIAVIIIIIFIIIITLTILIIMSLIFIIAALVWWISFPIPRSNGC